RRVGQMHGAHHVLVHRLDMALHGALVAGQACGLDTGEMAGSDEWIRWASLLRLACGLCRLSVRRFATACSTSTGRDGGNKPALHRHPFPPKVPASITQRALAGAIRPYGTPGTLTGSQMRCCGIGQ